MLNMPSIVAKSTCVFAACLFAQTFAQAKDYYIACYYSDSDTSQASKNPELMTHKLGVNPNYFWAKDSRAFYSKSTQLTGKIVDGFFVENSLSYEDVISKCNNALSKGTFLQPTKESFVLLDFKAAESDFSGYEYPIRFEKGNSEKSKIKQIVLFGDSLSDTGNLKRWTKVMPYFPFWYGRFTDGLIWVDYFSRRTEVPILNFSYGGAKTDGKNEYYASTIPDSIKAVGRNLITGNSADYIKTYLEKYLTSDSYVSTNKELANPEDTLFMLWIGANDYIEKFENKNLTKPFLDDPEHPSGINHAYKKTIKNIIDQIKLIYAKGGKHFLILNLPDLGKSPIVLTSEYSKHEDDMKNRLELSARLSDLTRRHNELLKESIIALQNSLADKIDITLIDIDENFSDLLSNVNINDKSKFDYGFRKINSKYPVPNKNGLYVQDFCYYGGYINAIFTKTNEEANQFAVKNSCKNPDGSLNKYSVFYNSPHPTSYAHCWLSYSIEKALEKKGLLATDVGSLSAFKNYCIEQIESNGKTFR
ncbi:SGNH/GDSL hydrolase family protein [Fluviispira vulneris]|uniref:SGNH/GDSL hydrolase family protein n=1 Tax=Fluviispira vulneris TaxID=2763012 RepID=UPI0016466DB2|nr:SGNH/GDSL hydrolase family protein [Fluviispira vulneris]